MQIMNYEPIEIVQILVSVFFSIVFFQSGIDKILDRKGNLDFFKDHFKDTPLNKILSPALNILIFLELITRLNRNYLPYACFEYIPSK